MKLFALVALLTVGSGSLSATGSQAQLVSNERPKLVVVISIDQFRADYLSRFQKHFSDGGFNLLLRKGANFANAHFEHAVTKTCPGHSVMLTGAHPNVSGIIANDWFNLRTMEEEYCARDDRHPLLGATGEGRSPKNLNATTVGDVLKETTMGRSKVISVSNKDRSAIMMGGQLADAAYWMVDSSMVSSTYYMEALPDWVEAFNGAGHVTSYFGSTWDRLLSKDQYPGEDDVASEDGSDGLGTTFPHAIDGGASEVTEAFIGAFESSPFATDVLMEFTIEALEQEGLGQGDATDLLAIGISTNDRVGHAFGPNSHEVMDITIRTDRSLERLFGYIDETIGLENVIIALTADHGVAPLPELVASMRPESHAGRLDPAVIQQAVGEALDAEFDVQAEWIAHLEDPYVYLNPAVLEEKGIRTAEAEAVVKSALEKIPVVSHVYTRTELLAGKENGDINRAVQLSFHPERSGHVFYQTAAYVLEDDEAVGTTHGSPWSYDTHVPFVLFGTGIQAGTHYERVGVADLAPTLSSLLNIGYPSAAHGRSLKDVIAREIGEVPSSKL